MDTPEKNSHWQIIGPEVIIKFHTIPASSKGHLDSTLKNGVI
jgi:hypothetical protein